MLSRAAVQVLKMIPRFLKRLAVICAVTACGLAALGYALLAALPDPCADQLVSESPSPDQRLRAVIFVRDCGASTGFVSHVAILEAGEQLGRSTDLVFSADTDHGRAPAGPGGGPEIRARWAGANQLVLTHSGDARVIRSKATRGALHIRVERLYPTQSAAAR